MLAATNNEYPKFAVLENVPGMYSSNGGLDFQEVLNELIHIKDESAQAHPRLSVPLPEKGKWSTAGEIVGDGFSVSWRTLTLNFGESPNVAAVVSLSSILLANVREKYYLTNAPARESSAERLPVARNCRRCCGWLWNPSACAE